ncbi:hypothetical protein CKAH01_09574 [Colletotrichum kahawae]|uniref:Uncharacterized protein n=1 Tax=Colletotrichum kahawae TaxID=34407 RepID=A0AAD9Y0M3_COLKA|nr:hypothetical protein CKAH01_09574 [Colletotrichum kahawae]
MQDIRSSQGLPLRVPQCNGDVACNLQSRRRHRGMGLIGDRRKREDGWGWIQVRDRSRRNAVKAMLDRPEWPGGPNPRSIISNEAWHECRRWESGFTAGYSGWASRRPSWMKADIDDLQWPISDCRPARHHGRSGLEYSSGAPTPQDGQWGKSLGRELEEYMPTQVRCGSCSTRIRVRACTLYQSDVPVSAISTTALISTDGGDAAAKKRDYRSETGAEGWWHGPRRRCCA